MDMKKLQVTFTETLPLIFLNNMRNALTSYTKRKAK